MLGILGLAAFVVERRSKEIAVRKLLGASVAGLWNMLSKDFVKLVAIACLIAVPLSWYYMTTWLQQFDLKTEVSRIIFVVAIW